MIQSNMTSVARRLTRMAVADFLKRFKQYAEKDGMVVFARSEYVSTLAALGILPRDAEEIILGLVPADYYQGIGPGNRDREEICEFGTHIGDQEIYIKLLLDNEHEKACCFSFHEAEREITYPFADCSESGGAS